MIKLPFVLAFTALTALSWGVYGIVLHKGTDQLGHSSIRAFIGVGIAYFLVAVLVPAIWLSSKPEKGHWSIAGTILSLFAGTVGALGALGVTLALAFKADPIYVMPIVFGGAPVVNTLVTSWINKSFTQIKPMFLVGLILVAFGAVGVLVNKPVSKKSVAAKSEAAAPAIVPESGSEQSTDATSSAETTPPAESATAAPPAEVKETSNANEKGPNPLSVGLAIAMAVVCWGAYGPVLHLGQSKMGGSRLRPFCCVGIAYFLIAVAVPVMILMAAPDGITLTFEQIASGMTWAVLAGGAGAMGALGIILAFNYGGKPIFVMPLVFGFAPVINTFVSMFVAGTLDKISLYFIGALLLGIAGAVTVLLFAPKAKPHAAAPAAAPKDATPTPAT
ncbi:MAG: hypothetical protein MUC43_03875 [Pirellula sp.]|jgi:hypothetical protein|nr:hypothetical protein [Pirellula sp.]